MQTVSLNYMNKSNLFIKYLWESLFCIFFLPFFMMVYIVFSIRKIIYKKNIFIKKTIEAKESFHIYYFNNKHFLIRKLPLLFWILKGQIALVGTTFDKGFKMGIFTLWQVRKNVKMSNQKEDLCDEEYLKNRNFIYDVKIFLKVIFTLLFNSSKNVYKEQITILGVKFNNDSLEQCLNFIQITVEKNIKRTLFFVNAHCLNESVVNKKYKKNLLKADYILADGSGINLACNILKAPLKENLNGTDLLPHICKLSCEKSYRIYLLGAQKGIAKTMKKNLEEKYKNIQIVGTCHGYFKNEKKLIKEINSKGVDILLVAMGVPHQENFIQKNKDLLNVKLFVAVGGLFDFYSNKTKRAPLFLRELGLEWFYRMMQEPRRMWKRYVLGNPKFIYRIYKYKYENLKSVNNYLNKYSRVNSKNIISIIFWKYELFFKNFVKRGIDIVCALLLLLLFTPLFFIVALIIKIESRGVIVFSQNRVGKDGKLFKMYKFRSMVENAQELKKQLEEKNESKDGVIFKIKDDPRITKFGKFIRKTSIDELPQLLNVLFGQMSLVGPRPALESEVEQYTFNDKKRLAVKPGITCIWQVSGRSKIPFKEQVELDKQYIKEQSLCKDINLLFKTIPAVLFSKGAY